MRRSPADEDTRVGGLVAGRYRLVRVIGEGGAGTVYAAREEGADHEVALKIVDLADGDDELRARSRREAKIARGLKHENVVGVVDFIDEEHRAIFAMELVPGETLAARIKRAPLSPAESVAVVSDVARALAAAHESGVLHRDLKPANVMLVPVDGGRTLAKVLDFGIALPMRSSTRLTQVGVVLGTRGYVAPECIRGARATAASDLYSVGVMWFEMLTGNKPHGAAVIDTGIVDNDDYDADVERYFRRAPRLGEVCQQPVSPALETLVAELLEPDAALRLSSAAGLIERLRRLGAEADDPTFVSIDGLPSLPAGAPVWDAAPTAPGEPARSGDTQVVRARPRDTTDEAPREGSGRRLLPRPAPGDVTASTGVSGVRWKRALKRAGAAAAAAVVVIALAVVLVLFTGDPKDRGPARVLIWRCIAFTSGLLAGSHPPADGGPAP